MIIPPRFNGPPNSANGGYACGIVSEALGGGFEVTLLQPPPLGVDLDLVGHELKQGDIVIAEARRLTVPVLEAPEPVSLEDAREASKGYPGFEHHAYPTCFVCGTDRDDGLRIFPGPVSGREGEGVVASPWTPHEVRPEIVWAALDCPSGWAVDDFQREGVLLGRMAATLRAMPETGREAVVIGWPLGEDGRKRFAGSALFDEAGDLLAAARSTWIVSTETDLAPAA
jgi:hypothetical protein